MPTVIVRHDTPIASTLDGTRDDLTVTPADTNDRVRELLPEADALVINPANWEDDLLEGLDRGDWVQATSTGYSAFPIDEFADRGITFTNATGNYGSPVADHAFALALGLARGIPSFLESQHERTWDRSHGSELIDLDGRTLTVAGLGDVGESVARRGRAFGMEVYGTKRDPDDYHGVLPSDRVLAPDELASMLPETELLVLTVPLTPETHHLIDRSSFEALPDSALLVNVARGPVVDQAALIDALESGAIAGAGLDVFDEEPLPESSPLWGFENAIVTPHVGGRSKDFVDRFVELFLHNYDRRTEGLEPKNRIA
ncbi:D-2-hydroxyacid dehydrogenase [Halorubrum sp. JWXQ-INN 858]|uniref:D-2-hydroxyacid dehydrogenase n=1 Tax=Halorubrum sp. JWXQ-INN 858 TaxID=2690782 RepID=UPI001356C854|nr:D-2-hydroxyacid dehydrogenase [Halorubrum sp. JWXQ-INN 858]MWV65591.1 D-2-hydroxyacid dehydrogenase [Halorubrum sp. JWXQ-INN 858]